MTTRYLLSTLCILGLIAISISGVACSQRADNPYYGYGYGADPNNPGFPNPYGPYSPQSCQPNDPSCNYDDDDYDDDDDNDDDNDNDNDECNHSNPDFQNPECIFWSDGATAALTNTNAFEDFADIMDLNTDHIDNIQFNLSVSNVGTTAKPLYGGTINIGFYNEADHEINEVEGEASLSADKIPYNHWVLHDKQYLKLFFEVKGGAFIVVAHASGDSQLLTGDIYFKEFNSTPCAVSNTSPWYGCGMADFYRGGNHCWNLPYDDDHFDHYSFNVHDCRAFLVDKDRDNGEHARVDTSSSIHPGITTYGSYRSIGRFQYLVPQDAGITLPQ